jgi:hypothetical protein
MEKVEEFCAEHEITVDYYIQEFIWSHDWIY